MHEWALAQAVIYTAIEHQKKEKFKGITELKIKMGELQQIDREIFKFALKEIAQFKKMMRMKIKIETEKALLQCRVCGHRWGFSDFTEKLDKDKAEFIHFIPDVAHIYLRCPECGSPDFEIVKGRGVWINSIEGVK
ncbi:MAG: hydrogenase nickel incorporation protein HypA [Candidatus Aerophobetes bacterium]|nr:hydrogenase nickel incorporation protein HypA [Candidatus Aerophobetes bacterium]